MKRLTDLSDRHLLTLLRTGKKNGARPFLRHPRVMIEMREEVIRRDLMPPDPTNFIITNEVLNRAAQK